MEQITSIKWDAGKKQHLELSDKAAQKYDELYADSNFATGSYMKYELEVVDRAITFLDKNRRRLALDLGCGTGRDAFHFHKVFQQVRGYDFSSGMINIAQAKKLTKAAGNVQFIVRDLEVDRLTDVNNASVTFINSGFGMGSFVQELSLLLREVKRVLEPGGIFVVSFYNRESLVVQIDNLQWMPSLAARLDPSTGFLKVNFQEQTFDVPVKAYSIAEAREILQSYFEILEISSFPTLSALFPNNIFTSEKARKLCTLVDKELRLNTDIAGGPYLAAICQKRGRLDSEKEPTGYANIIRLLADNDIQSNIKEHAPVGSPDDVAKMLNISMNEMVKCILIRTKQKHSENHPSGAARKYYAVALQADRKMDFAKVAHLLKIDRHEIEIATAHELEENTGFSMGGIPPFGYPHSINVILDEPVAKLGKIYCGTGKRTETLRISVDDLLKLASPVRADISK